MAALNRFKTVAVEITTTSTSIYTVVPGYVGIILMAQLSNITTTSKTITFSHVSVSATQTDLLRDFSIPGNDAVSAIAGKLVLAAGESIKVKASASSSVNLVLSILESQQES